MRCDDKSDLVESNDIEVLRTSDYNEGSGKAAIEQLVADQEIPPAELDLPAADLTLPNEQELPTAALDLPTFEVDEPSTPVMEEVASDEVVEESDNYLLGDLEGARKQREMQTRKAGIQYWSEGLAKYRPRSERIAADGTTGTANYFDVLREEPMLRQVELQRPGMAIDQLNLAKFMNNSLKGKLVSEFVLRSMRLIREQQENGMVPEWTGDTTSGALARDMHQKTLRDMFNAYEAQMRLQSTSSNPMEVSEGSDEELTASEIDELLQHFAEIFQHVQEDDNKESYNRWLLNVAEDGDASDDILWLLVEDENPDVRFCLAENYNIDPNMLKVLSEDENPYVAHRARKTLMRMEKASGRVVDQNFSSGESRIRKMG